MSMMLTHFVRSSSRKGLW